MVTQNLIFLYGMGKIIKMNYKISWLPELIEYGSKKNNQDEYIEAIYLIYKEEFINKGIYFRKEKLGLKRLPLRNGKEATFYHIISEGKDEEQRDIDLERCARIKWPRAILASDYVGLKIWENKRKNKRNILVWFPEKEYLIIIRKNPNEKLIWTAYPVTENHRKRKLQKEYEEYIHNMQKSP